MSPHFSSFHQVSRIPYIFCLPVAWKQKCEILDSWNIKLLCWSQNFNICWQSEGRPAAAAAGSKQCAVTGGWQHRGVEGFRYRDMGVYHAYNAKYITIWVYYICWFFQQIYSTLWSQVAGVYLEYIYLRLCVDVDTCPSARWGIRIGGGDRILVGTYKLFFFFFIRFK